MPAPTWLAATSGQPGLAGQVNQFLGAHAVSYVYAGTQVAAQTTLGAGAVNSSGLYMAQSFTTGAFTATGRVVIYLAVTGAPTVPLTVGLYANGTSAPGSLLVSTAMPKEFLSGTAAAVSLPLPSAVTASATYWIVTQPAGDASNYYSWSKSNQVSGASTSPDGVTWTAQGYGLYYQVLSQAVTTGSLRHTWEDSGARWTSLAYNAGGQVTKLSEYTAGQTANGYTVTSRALSYSGGTLTGVA